MKILPKAALAALLSILHFSQGHAMGVMHEREARETLNAITSQEIWLNTSRKLEPNDLVGRVILLDFWTFCCINCMHVIPDLHYLEEKFGDKLTVIGVHSAKFANEQDTENIRQAMLRYDITHPVVNDFDFTIWRKFGVRAWPSFVLINPNGRVEQVYSGEGNREQVERDIGRLVTQAGDALNDAPLPIALEQDKAAQTLLKFPGKLDIAPDFDGAPMLFISDSAHHRIVGARLDGTSEILVGEGHAGLKDGDFAAAQFHSPQGVLWDAATKTLFVADTENHALRAVNFVKKTVETLAGDGMQGYERSARGKNAKSTRLASPWDVAFYPDKNHLLIAMAGTHQLWSYDRDKATLTVVAGNGRESIDDGAYPLNSLSQPSGFSVHGDTAYFVDSETSSLRAFKGGKVKTLIGTGLFDFGYAEGGMGTGLMQHPLGVYADDTGVYIADSYNHAIRRYDMETGKLSNFSGTGKRGESDGALAQAEWNEPNDIIAWQGKYYVADTNNHRIRVIDPASGQVSTLDIRAASATGYDSDLPELQSLPEQTISAAKPVSLSLGFKAGWKLNKAAPSYLALFTAQNHALVKQYAASDLKAGATLPPLDVGKAYILQGTLYYCEDKEGSVCLIKSVEIPLKTAESGASRLMIPVNGE